MTPTSELEVTSQNAIVDYAVSALEAMQPKLVNMIASSLRPQLAALKGDLKQLQEDEIGARSPYAASPRIPAEFASAIEASLSPRFDTLERETAVLAERLPLSMRSPLSNQAHDAASVMEVLLPQITQPLAAKIEDMMAARIGDPRDYSLPSPVAFPLGSTVPATPNDSNDTNNTEPTGIIATSKKRVQVDEVSVEVHPRTNNATDVRERTGRSDLACPSEATNQKSKSVGALRLPVPVHERSTSSSCHGTTQRHSDIERNRQPARAFVVNFRRLLIIQKILGLIHLFIKSTAIATLTLVSSAFWTDLLFSVIFVASTLAIYAIHEMRYDGMDIEDYKAVCGLLRDDDGGVHTGKNGEVLETDNPNRLLKALTLSKNHRRRRRSALTMASVMLLTIAIWGNVFWAWSEAEEPAEDEAFEPKPGDEIAFVVDSEAVSWSDLPLNKSRFEFAADGPDSKPHVVDSAAEFNGTYFFTTTESPDHWAPASAAQKVEDLWFQLFTEDDITAMATQMLIGTVMLLFHGIFEWLYWRETQCVMCWDDENDCPWDPRSKAKKGRGVPRSKSWFGLPSMWFTSREAYDDVRLWITLATSKDPSTYVETKMFPEEMAGFAIDPDNACDLRKTLKDAKLYSLADGDHCARDDDETRSKSYRKLQPGEEPEALNVDLVFYDAPSEQFLEPHPSQAYQGSLMSLLDSNSRVNPLQTRSGYASDPWPSDSWHSRSGHQHDSDSPRETLGLPVIVPTGDMGHVEPLDDVHARLDCIM
jgi:hypothetical protein